jgi:hypothetical protein
MLAVPWLAEAWTCIAIHTGRTLLAEGVLERASQATAAAPMPATAVAEPTRKLRRGMRVESFQPTSELWSSASRIECAISSSQSRWPVRVNGARRRQNQTCEDPPGNSVISQAQCVAAILDATSKG